MLFLVDFKLKNAIVANYFHFEKHCVLIMNQIKKGRPKSRLWVVYTDKLNVTVV